VDSGDWRRRGVRRARVWLVTAKLPHLLSNTEPVSGADKSATAAAGDGRKIHATLFFVAEDGTQLVSVGRDVPFAETPEDQARRILESLAQAPTGGLGSALPTGTSVRSVFLTAHGEAFADFGPEIVANHAGGSLEESLTVFAIVNALTVNLPNITAVQILVSDKEVDTLAGHLDLRRPLGRSLKWVRKGQ